MKVNEYRINPNVETGGTHRFSEVMLKPVELLMVFGKPHVCDSYKVSGEYIFEHTETGTPITLYDWKYTTLYDETDGIKPVDFWKLDEEVQFNIGSTNSMAFGFNKWITYTIENTLNQMNEGIENE
jgi:hypothetical protein|tara:strand:+ start:522 stop:899 length:378 start_codon:yes stop_codon:yes gene_type:complete